MSDVVHSAQAADDVVTSGHDRSLTYDAWQILKRRWLFWLGIILVGSFAIMAIFPQLFLFFNPADTDISGSSCNLREGRLAPSSEHWFGTDQQGCDYYVRVIYGAQVSMRVALGATAVTATLGLLLGALAGYYGSWIDTILSRVADGFFALPYLVGAIIILSALSTQGSRSEIDVLIAIAFLGWPAVLRLFRGQVLQVKTMEYVESARALGASDYRILRKHIFPNAIAPVLIYSTIGMGAVISVEATLSFLGIGLPLGTISWGIMINDAQRFVRAGTDIHLLIFPGIFLVLASLGFVVLGEELREAFDPRSR